MARINVDGLLDSAFRIRPGEARPVFYMFFYLMGVVSTFIIGRTVRDTLFLHRVELAKLPLMYMATAVAVAMAAYGYSRVADKYRRDKLIANTLLLFSGLTFTFWALIEFHLAGEWLYGLLYVLVEILGAISIIQFWTFASDIFSGRQGKRLFGFIGAGGVLSNIICGFGIGAIAPIIGSANLLLITGVLFFLCTFAVRAIGRRSHRDLEAAVKGPRKRSLKIQRESGTVFHSKHLKMIAAIVVLTFLTVTVIDYQFKVVAKMKLSGEGELASYFGYFYGFTGIISSLMQFFVTGRLLERSGIVISLLVLPIAILSGAGSMLFVPLIPMLAAVTIAKGAENIFRYTVNDATMQLLYVPVPSHNRGRAKAFIDGILKPASIGASGLVIYLLGRVFTSDQLVANLAYADIALLGGWILLVFSIRGEYVKSLIDTLHARRLDLGDSWSPVVDDATLKTLKTRLLSDEEQHVLHALELLPSIDADFFEELSALLEHESMEVRIAAVAQIGASGRVEGASAIHPLLADDHPEVRAAAIGAFCAIGRERAIRAASPFLNDPSGEVRAAAVAALILHGGLDGILTAAETLKHFLSSEDPEERLQGARVLGAIKVKNFFQPVLELLQDENPRVRLAAVEAAGAMKSRELVPSLIYKLSDRHTNTAAVRALIGYGREIEKTLFKVIGNKREDVMIRRLVPKVLGRIGEQDAVTKLLENLDTPDAELRANIARAAARIRERSPGVRVLDEVLDKAIETEIRDAYQALAIIADLGLPDDHLLPEALYVRHQSKLGLAFRLLEIRYPSRTIQLVYTNLDAENKAVRANAIEVVDNLLTKEETKLLLPLLEDHTFEEKLKAGHELFDLERADANTWLARLLKDTHPWVVVCTLHLIGERRMLALKTHIARHLESRDPIVRETACFTLASLLQETADSPEFDKSTEELRALAERVAKDEVLDVRKASDVLLGVLIPAV